LVIIFHSTQCRFTHRGCNRASLWGPLRQSLNTFARHGVFNNERIAGRTWPLADKHVVILELTD